MTKKYLYQQSLAHQKLSLRLRNELSANEDKSYKALLLDKFSGAFQICRRARR